MTASMFYWTSSYKFNCYSAKAPVLSDLFFLSVKKRLLYFGRMYDSYIYDNILYTIVIHNRTANFLPWFK